MYAIKKKTAKSSDINAGNTAIPKKYLRVDDDISFWKNIKPFGIRLKTLTKLD